MATLEEFNKICTGLQHVGLPTLDMDATVKFYGLLGFHIAHTKMNKGNKVNFLGKGNFTIESYEDKNAIKHDGAIQHIALDVKDIQQAWDYVSTLGYKFIDTHIMELPFWEKGIRYFNIKGPNEEVVEFCQIVQ